MIIYYEPFLFINCLIHYFIIRSIGRLLNVKVKKFFLIISLIIDCIYLVIYTIFFIPFIFKLIIGLIISFMTFSNKKLYSSILYFVANFLLGGISFIVYTYNNNYMVMIIISLLILIFVIELISHKKYSDRIDNFMYEAKIINDGIVYQFKAFLDSGCNIVDEYNIPIIFINKIIGRKKSELIVSTINGESIIDLYEVDSFYLKRRGVWEKLDVYVSISNIGYDMLLNINLFK